MYQDFGTTKEIETYIETQQLRMVKAFRDFKYAERKERGKGRKSKHVRYNI